MKISKALSDFENKINSYFSDCEEKGVYPDEAGLILSLGISQDTYDLYKDNPDGKYSGFSRCIDKARLRRESLILRDIYSSDSKSGKLFLAKLPANRSRSPAQSPDDKPAVEVLINGDSAGFFE